MSRLIPLLLVLLVGSSCSNRSPEPRSSGPAEGAAVTDQFTLDPPPVECFAEWGVSAQELVGLRMGIIGGAMKAGSFFADSDFCLIAEVVCNGGTLADESLLPIWSGETLEFPDYSVEPADQQRIVDATMFVFCPEIT